MNFEPLLAGAPVMEMLSPGFMVVLVQPLWRRKLGLLISIAHSSTTPYVVLHVDIHECVGIGPLDLGHYACQRDRVSHVEHGAGVVRVRGSREHDQEACGQDGNRRSPCEIPRHATF